MDNEIEEILRILVLIHKELHTIRKILNKNI